MARKTYTYAKVKGFRRLLADLPEDVRVELLGRIEVVNEDIAEAAKREALSLGGVSALVAPSIKSVRGRNPTVRMGGRRKLPRSGDGWGPRKRTGPRQTIGDVVFGAEFGSNQPQFPGHPHRGNHGWFLFPVVRANMERIVEACADAIPLGVDRAA